MGSARPAFGTNAICRMQIQPSLDKGPGWIALQGDCLFRKRGRAMLVPTHVEARTLLRGAHCAPLPEPSACRGRQGAVPTERMLS